jgi:hypothetical protein
MLHSPFAHNERLKANKAANGQLKTRRWRVLVVTTIEVSGLSARLQFVLSQRPQPHNSDAFFYIRLALLAGAKDQLQCIRST